MQNPETHLCLQIRTGHCSVNKQQVFLINLLYRKKLLIFQETLVPKLTLGTFLTLGVRNGQNLQSYLFQAYLSLNPSRVKQNYTKLIEKMAKIIY